MSKFDKPISPAELKVLEILWAKSPLGAAEIVEKIAAVEAWHSRTIKTLISRLVKKKILGHKEQGNRYLYFPLLRKKDYQKSISLNFIQRVFGGKLSPLVAHFAQEEKLTQEDVKEIKEILRRLSPHE